MHPDKPAPVLLEHHLLEDVAKPERVVVVLHGIGEHTGYMTQAAQAIADRAPNTLVVMPEAPIHMHYSPEKSAHIREKYDPAFDPEKARSWFKTQTAGWPLLSLRLLFNSLPVVHQVNALADHYRDKYNLADKDVAFFGMSQGGAVALYSAIAREKPVAAVVSHSGMFFGFAPARSKPEVLMITGDDDHFLCDNKSPLRGFFMAPENSIRRLARRGIPITEIRIPGLGHAMNETSLKNAADFIYDAFGRPALPAPRPLSVSPP